MCHRFLDTRERPAVIEEECIDFANIGRATGKTIANKLLEILQGIGVPIKNIRGQAYDGALAMASEKLSCQGRIKSANKLAVYTHCRSHVLNFMAPYFFSGSLHFSHFFFGLEALSPAMVTAAR